MTKNVFSSISHASNRRKTSLQESDCDHEIHLIDHDSGAPQARGTQSAGGSHENLSSQRHSLDTAVTDDEELSTEDTEITVDGTRRKRRRSKVNREVQRKRWSKKWTADRPAERAGQVVVTAVDGRESSPAPSTSGVVEAVPTASTETEDSARGRPTSKQISTRTNSKHKRKHTDCETAIDVLYENQRGGFLCGFPLFSSKALGLLDHAPWTNIAFKPSATSINNAQPPDPSWEWAWPEWRINHDPALQGIGKKSQDEDGWEYSFMFTKGKCSWHGPTWYNSFVRRRAWIRTRVKKHDGSVPQEEGHGLAADYFTIHSQRMRLERTPSPSKFGSKHESTRDGSEAVDRDDIRDIQHLIAALHDSRIDREKMEVIENFVLNSGDDLFYLGKRMKDVMGMFIFQASRRVLLAHLVKTLDGETERLRRKSASLPPDHKATDEEIAEKERADKRISNLMIAVRAADEEVKRLEYWSDIKEIAEEGATKGAVDREQNWGEEWTGLIISGPKPVITEANQPGGDEELAERHDNPPDRVQERFEDALSDSEGPPMNTTLEEDAEADERERKKVDTGKGKEVAFTKDD